MDGVRCGKCNRPIAEHVASSWCWYDYRPIYDGNRVVGYDMVKLKDPHEALYERGIAIGESSIRNDAMFFRFRDETFEFPLMTVHPYMRAAGAFYQAHIDDLRKLKAEQAAG